MTRGCDATACNCTTLAKNGVKLWRAKKEVKLFPARAPLESVALDILGSLIKIRRGHIFLLVIANRYSRLTRTVPLNMITALAVPRAFIHQWVLVHELPREVRGLDLVMYHF